jgi:hypothetical protein
MQAVAVHHKYYRPDLWTFLGEKLMADVDQAVHLKHHKLIIYLLQKGPSFLDYLMII